MTCSMVFRTRTYVEVQIPKRSNRISPFPTYPLKNTHEAHSRLVVSFFPPFFHSGPRRRVFPALFFSLPPHTIYYYLFHKAATTTPTTTTTTTVDNNNNNNDNNNSVPSFKFRSFVRRLPSLSFIFVCLLFFVYCFWQ